MGLAQRKPTAIKKGPTCTIGLLLAAMDTDDRTTLASWLDDPRTYPGTWIADQLTDEYGQRVGDSTIQRHRKGRCLCTVESS
jgi:hypothetical protein